MNTEKISREVAEKEVDNWLSTRRLSPKKRASLEDSIETLIDGIQYGTMTINENGSIKYDLAFPVLSEDNKPVLESLEFKPRIKTEEITSRMKGIKTSDTYAMVSAYLSALTDQPTSVLGKLDTADGSVIQSIVLFFL